MKKQVLCHDNDWMYFSGPVRMEEDGRLKCYACGERVANTANHEMRKEGGYSHDHSCRTPKQKFLVLKKDDIDELDDFEIHLLDMVLEEITSNRRKRGKYPFNYYWVVNQDEPYADRVKELIFGSAQFSSGIKKAIDIITTHKDNVWDWEQEVERCDEALEVLWKLK